GTLSDGRWEENFSPNLTVLKTRVFVKRGGLILYAKPYRVTVNHLSCFPTDSDFEHDFSILNDCYGTHRTLTPTYLHAAPTNKLLWEFEFQRDPKELGLTETGEEVTGPEGDLFVEFIIVDVNAKIEQALYSSPKNLHFGDVAYTYTKANDVIIQNTSANERLEVQRILIEGFNAKEFEFALNPGVSLPVLLDPNDSLSVRVTAKPLWGALMPQAQSQPTRLRVYAETLNGSIPLETSTQLAAEWVSGPHLYLFPYAEKGMVIEFTRNSLSESEEFIKFFSIHNVGTLPLRREALQIVDRVANSGDAAAFRFVSSRRTGDWTQAYEVQPGTFDDFYIEFIPPEGSQTDFFAEVVITSNDTSDGNRGYGEIRLGLNGVKN
ncbi:MAG: hypothetical protein ACE5FU_00525, partial [Nitrospinota bacterium]